MSRSLPFLTGAALAMFTLAAADSPTSQVQSLPKDLGSYEHVNSIVVPDPQSPVMGFHHFYLSETGRKTFQAAKDKAEYPAGTVFVGKVYRPIKTEDGAYKEGELLAYTLMRKAPDSAATKDTGGWHFLKFDSEGQPVKINAVADCFQCHQPHAATDFVISQPLE